MNRLSYILLLLLCPSLCLGQAFDIGGDGVADSAVDLGDNALTDLVGQTDAMTYMCRFRWITGELNDTFGCLIARCDNLNNQVMFFVRNSGILGMVIGDVLSDATTDTGDGKWHHAAFTAPAGSTGAKIYLDGVLEAFTTGSGGIGTVSVTRDTLIGSRRSGTHDNDKRFDGDIADVRIIPRELSASEIMTIANSQGPDGITGQSVGHYYGNTRIMTDTIGVGSDPLYNTSFDLSGNGFTGIITNSVRMSGTIFKQAKPLHITGL